MGLGCLLEVSSGWAATASVTSQAGVSIPPLYRISIHGTPLSGREVLVVVTPQVWREGPTGWLEASNAVRIVVHSNVLWRLRVRDPTPERAGWVAVRVGEGEYRLVTAGGVVLARGGPGVHELCVDYRLAPGQWDPRGLPLVYEIEG